MGRCSTQTYTRDGVLRGRVGGVALGGQALPLSGSHMLCHRVSSAGVSSVAHGPYSWRPCSTQRETWAHGSSGVAATGHELGVGKPHFVMHGTAQHGGTGVMEQGGENRD